MSTNQPRRPAPAREHRTDGYTTTRRRAFAPRSRTTRWEIPALALVVAGCAASDGLNPVVDDEPSAIRVSVEGSPNPPSELSMEVGDSLRLTGDVLNSIGQVMPEFDVTWSSGASGVVTVTSDGLVRAVGSGSTEVVAAAADLTTNVPIRVLEPAGQEPVQPSTLEISPSSFTIVGVGGTRQLEVTARDSLDNVISPLVSWESLDPSVATVNGLGLVEARAVGTALIVVASSCCSSDTAQVRVENPVSTEGLLLQSDWSTATGNSFEAVSDGGKGLVRWCVWDEVLSVVPGAPLNWTRTSNVLGIRSIDNCGHVEYENLFPLPCDNEEQFWAARFYVMNGVGQSDSKDHPLTFWPVGAIEMVHLALHRVQPNGDWSPRYIGTTSPNDFPFGVVLRDDDGRLVHIPAGTWIRYEFILHWRNATEFRWYPRVYDVDGNLLYDEFDWKHTDTNLSIGEWYARSPANVLTRRPNSPDPNNIRTFAFGMGQAGSSGERYYIADAAFALVSGPDAFIGASGGP